MYTFYHHSTSDGVPSRTLLITDDGKITVNKNKQCLKVKV